MTTTPVHVFARWKVKEGNRQTVLKLLQEVRSKTIREKGNLFYKIHQSQADANTLILFEGYADAVAQQAHTNADHFKRVVVEQIVPLLEEREVTLTTPIGD
ncbi:antibiotic biosynthesis monooxygenase [Pseudoflavitalea sp. X16]|uniref:putative quinol monooxygenase n=1 Tax=Paraflavitalea devenefica TaxID=2716334 RepID=UPI00141FB8F0|nr:putative quinol monooxygenase [Paraflavitalea devenefica]NII26409.1 antibiotic biosynthesis monooxygenase [Paraflavitalea devenefica]